jgi:hypothetical protein
VRAEVVIHDDLSVPNTPDEDWLGAVGKKQLIVLSRDGAIRRRPNERRAIEEAKVVAFLLTSANLTGQEMGELFARALPRRAALATLTKGPAIFTFGKSGRPPCLSLQGRSFGVSTSWKRSLGAFEGHRDQASSFEPHKVTVLDFGQVSAHTGNILTWTPDRFHDSAPRLTPSGGATPNACSSTSHEPHWRRMPAQHPHARAQKKKG